MSLLQSITNFVTKYFDKTTPSRRLLSLTWFTCGSRDEAKRVNIAVKNALTGPDGLSPRVFVLQALNATFQADGEFHIVVLCRTSNVEVGKRFNLQGFSEIECTKKVSYCLKDSRKGILDTVCQEFSAFTRSNGQCLVKPIFESLVPPQRSTESPTRPNIAIAVDQTRRIMNLETEVAELRDQVRELRDYLQL
jgi:hypothetical protein